MNVARTASPTSVDTSSDLRSRVYLIRSAARKSKAIAIFFYPKVVLADHEVGRMTLAGGRIGLDAACGGQ